MKGEEIFIIARIGLYINKYLKYFNAVLLYLEIVSQYIFKTKQSTTFNFTIYRCEN